MNGKDHPDQVVDTDLPDGEFVDEEAWKSMRDNAEQNEEG